MCELLSARHHDAHIAVSVGTATRGSCDGTKLGHIPPSIAGFSVAVQSCVTISPAGSEPQHNQAHTKFFKISISSVFAPECVPVARCDGIFRFRRRQGSPEVLPLLHVRFAPPTIEQTRSNAVTPTRVRKCPRSSHFSTRSTTFPQGIDLHAVSLSACPLFARYRFY